jgi:hypothetical protein
MPLRFNALLADEGIAPSDVRLLRHQQTGKVRGRTPYSLWRDDPDAFERSQSTQVSAPRERSKFRSRFWASFVVPPGGATLFVGLYEVTLIGSVQADTVDPLTGEFVGHDKDSRPYDQYECHRSDYLLEYAGRLFIHWGDSPSASRAWVQRADNQDKIIVELTRAFREEAFPGFTKLVRPLSEIETMPLGWQEVLRASRGIYLLACPKTREHYVGSAYGDGGFLSRWRSYVATGHGGNVALRGRDPSDYLVSILEVVGSNTSVEEIVALETTWKLKLHSRDMGLNRN